MDWAIANAGSNTIWVYLGNGDGTWQLPRIIAVTGLSPVALATGDLNHDGKLDLVVGEADSGTVGVLLGNGDGTFGPELSFTTPGLPESVAVADFNNDGNLDVVVGQFGDASVGQLAFFAGDGTGKLGNPITHYGQIDEALFTTYSLAVADLDGDGLPDIVALDYSVAPIDGSVDLQEQAANARVYLNQGDGTFKMAQQLSFGDTLTQDIPFSIGATALALGDINKDGCVDAVILDTTGTANAFPGLCNGTFDTANAKIFATGVTAGAAALADVNGDGNLDLVATGFLFTDVSPSPSSDGVSVAVLFGDGSGNFGTPSLFRGEPGMFAVAAVDLNGDHFPEILTANQGSDTASIYLNDGHGGFGGPKGGYLGYLANGQMHAIVNAPITNFGFVDANGDGHKDLVALETGTQNPLPIQVTVLPGDGAGNFGAPIRSPILDADYTVSDLALEDFRNTKRPDMLVLGITSGSGSSFFYGLAKNNGDGTYQKPSIVLLPNAFVTQFVVGDFNNDGNLDFLVLGTNLNSSSSAATASLIPFLGDGTGNFAQGQPISFSLPAGTNGPTHAFAGDFNHDGKMDLLVQASGLLNPTDQNALYELLGNGDGTFQPASLLFNNFGYFKVADLNGDGLPDIVELQGVGLSTRNSPLPGKMYQIYLGNSDGTFSIGASYGPFPGAFGTGYLFGSADQPMHVNEPAVADFNGDGIPDLAVFQYVDGESINLYATVEGAVNSSVEILAGNGDGTFTTPNFAPMLGRVVVPQTYGDVNGDNRADLVEMNGYTSSYNILSATTGPSFSVGLVSDPVIGTQGKLRITLANPAAGSVALQLSASDPNISLPGMINISQGANSQDVPFQIGSGFNQSRLFALTAALGAESHIAYGSQAPAGTAAGFSAEVLYTGPPVIVASQSTPDYGLLMASDNGYSTQIQVSCQGLPKGANCLIGTNPVLLPAGQVFTDSLVVTTTSAVPTGMYNFTILLTDGVLSETIPAAFNVGDFGFSITPSSQTVGTTDSTFFTLQVPSIDGYTQGVQITCSGLPAGTFCPFNISVFPATPGNNVFQIVTQNAVPGPYNFTLTGTSGLLEHSASAQLIVSAGNFSGSISPSSATINVGSSQNFTVQLQSIDGFQGEVSVNCVSPPAGVACKFNPAQLNLGSNETASSVLSISVSVKPAFLSPRSLGFFRNGQAELTVSRRSLFLAALCVCFFSLFWHHTRSTVKRKFDVFPIVLFALLLTLGASSCGSAGGGGGANGGTTPITVQVIVQGIAGSATVNLGTVNVTVP